MNLKLKHGILSFLSLLMLFATLYIPEKFDNSNDVKEIKFGYPFHFVSQNFIDNYNMSPSYFRRFSFDIEKIKNFYFLNFISSYVVIIISVEVLIYALEVIKYKVQ